MQRTASLNDPLWIDVPDTEAQGHMELPMTSGNGLNGCSCGNLRAMPSFRAEGTIKAWLCGIARHVCAHVLETRRKRNEVLELVPEAGEARDAFAARQRARHLRDALAKLKPSEREALVMKYVADLSHREIAVACGLDEAAARKRISRALARMRAVMPTEEMG